MYISIHVFIIIIIILLLQGLPPYQICGLGLLVVKKKKKNHVILVTCALQASDDTKRRDIHRTMYIFVFSKDNITFQ